MNLYIGVRGIFNLRFICIVGRGTVFSNKPPFN